MEPFALQPREFMTRLEQALSNPDNDPAALGRSTEMLTALWLETVQLTGGRYKPRFDLQTLAPGKDAVGKRVIG